MPQGQQHPKEKTQELQRRLYLAAKRSKERRFHALYDRIFRLDILWRAWLEVKKNGGCAGVDGISIDDVEHTGVIDFLAEIIEELKGGKYIPQAVLRVYIPKPDGRQRPLGIPTVKDRVVQQACKIVIEPIFEANFHECSYGCRPKRSAQEALLAVKEALVSGWWVVEADIQDYFNNIDHEILMSLLARRISDRRVLKMLRKWLQAGVVEDGELKVAEKGSPQGGVISPLLANIYLHVLDSYWEGKLKHLGKLYRYCDDFVIICKTQQQAIQAKRIIGIIMERLKVRLHPTKTRIIYMVQMGFDFLGFHFHKLKSRKNGKLIPQMWPSQKAMKAIRRNIGELTNRREMRISLREIVEKLNMVIRGWRNYFRIGNSTKKLRELDWYIRVRLWYSARIRKGSRGSLNRKTFQIWIEKCGVEHFYTPGICKV